LPFKKKVSLFSDDYLESLLLLNIQD